jgi:type IV pilus assembly protein PilA
VVVDRQQGFTLIELMIVVAIVATLAAIALPVYQDYLARSQVTEALMSASQVKNSVTEYYSAQGVWPPANTYADPTGGRYTASVVHNAAGVITVSLRNLAPVNARVRGRTLSLSPALGGSGGTEIVSWSCAPGTMDAKYVPSGCQ